MFNQMMEFYLRKKLLKDICENTRGNGSKDLGTCGHSRMAMIDKAIVPRGAVFTKHSGKHLSSGKQALMYHWTEEANYKEMFEHAADWAVFF